MSTYAGAAAHCFGCGPAFWARLRRLVPIDTPLLRQHPAPLPAAGDAARCRAVASMVDAARPTHRPTAGACSQSGRGIAQRTAATISIDDFAKLDLRVARVADAAAVEGSDKLLG